jgi:Surface lipoprotein assembly modifier/Tetratricopeptide repeat
MKALNMPARLKPAVARSLILVFFLVAAFGSPPVSADEATHPPGYAVKNQEAVNKLRRMSRQEIDNLDVLIGQALTHYYDRAYATALPIFQEVAEKVETMDILFWIGNSAACSGKYELAREQYEKMLHIDPSLDRVRLELAAVYFALGQDEAAGKEMATVKAGNPPPEVLASIREIEDAMDKRSRKYVWNARLNVGWIWDDNITSGPDPGIYTLPGGSTFRPAQGSSKIRDSGFLATFSGNVLYDVGDRDNFLWNTGVNVYNKNYCDYSEYDYLAANFYTGPWWAGRNDIVKLPFNITDTYYGGDRLSYIMSVDPSYTHFFSPWFSLQATYTYKDERFHEDNLAGDLDNISHIVELAPTFYFLDRTHILTARAGYDDHAADNRVFGYTAPYAAVSYFVRLPIETELYLAYQWSRREYREDQPFPYTGEERTDERNYYTASISQPFMKNFYVSYAFAYTDNRSDLDLYDWDKTTHTISVGYKF